MQVPRLRADQGPGQGQGLKARVFPGDAGSSEAGRSGDGFLGNTHVIISLFQHPDIPGVHLHPPLVHLRDGEGGQAGRHRPGVRAEDGQLQAQGAHPGGCVQGGRGRALGSRWGLDTRAPGASTSGEELPCGDQGLL